MLRSIVLEVEEDHKEPAPEKRRRKRRWPRFLLVFVVLLIGLLFWLNGPGLRWLGPMVAAHFMEKAGLEGTFTLEGSLTGGIAVAGVEITGAQGGVKRIAVGRAEPSYDFWKLVKGDLAGFRGLVARDVRAELRSGIPGGEKPKEGKPLDLRELVRTIRGARAQVLPLHIDLRNLSLATERDGKPEFILEPTDIIHQPGSEVIELRIGRMTAPQDLVLPPQQSALVWAPERISLEKLDPYPGIGLRNLELDLPADADPAARLRILLDEGVFDLETGPGFSAATLSLTSGSVEAARTAAAFGVRLPASARLTSFALNLDGVYPDPLAATGHAQIGFDTVAYQDWRAAEVVVGVTLDQGKAALALAMQAPGTPVAVDAEVPVTRDGAKFQLGELAGSFRADDVRGLVKELSTRFPQIKADPPAPLARLTGTFRAGFNDLNAPASAAAEVVLKPADPQEATDITVTAEWKPDAPAKAGVVMDGAKANAIYDLESRIYSGTLSLENFTNARIDRWLAVGGISLGGNLAASGRWQGRGDLAAAKHDGELVLERADWLQPDRPPVDADGGVTYEWPGKVDVTGLRVHTQEQTLLVDGGLADGMLELKRFTWSDGGLDMAGGTAVVPVPEDFTQWREMLAEDERTIDVALESKVLPLERLKAWVPAAARFDPASTGFVKVRIAGTYAAPTIDVAVELLNVRTPEKPDIPPADLKITLKGDQDWLTLDGTAATPGYPPVLIKASMPFKPSGWAAEPDTILREPIEAKVQLPKIDLSRFTSLLPTAEKLTGTATGDVVASGTVGEPKLLGHLELVNGGLVLKGDFPPITGVAADIGMTLDGVEVRTLKATVAGGSVQAGGKLALADGKPGDINLSLRASHLPLVRNDMMIVRASANLDLTGPFEKARLAGTVGVVDSLFYRDIELLPIGTTSRGGLAAAELPKIDAAQKNPTASVPKPFADWGLDVTVRTDDPFLIRGNLGTGEARINIKVGGTVGNPAPDGTVRIRDGVAVLPFSTLKVADGYVRFTPETGFDPILEIRGQAEPRPYRVNVYVHGRLSDPQLVLTSNPPLPENEIMALLATGTTTAGLENTQAASSRALQLLLEELRRGRLPFARQLRPVFRVLDRVDFNLAESDPYDSDKFTTATIALTDRWFISAGMGPEGSRVLGIWRLTFR